MGTDTPQPVYLEFEAHKDRKLALLLFKDIGNHQEIRQHVASNSEPQFAFFNAEVVADIFPVHIAAHKALTAEAQGNLLTKTLHTELVYNISGSKHIVESLRRFGVAEDTKHLLVARFDATQQDVEFVQQLVQGSQVAVEQLKDIQQPELINKLYKITPAELKIGTAVEAVACRMAVREFEK